MPPLKPEKPKREFSWSKLSKTVSFWILVILIPVVMLQALGARGDAERKINYTTFLDELDAGNISQVTIQGGKTIVGRFKSPITVENKSATRFTTSAPSDVTEKVQDKLREKNVV